MDRAIEVRDLAAQIIDPFGRCDRAGEDGALDLFDVGFEVRAPRSSLATPCRTVMTKLGPTKMLISPKSTSPWSWL
jgi:hypothetical protein